LSQEPGHVHNVSVINNTWF